MVLSEFIFIFYLFFRLQGFRMITRVTAKWGAPRKTPGWGCILHAFQNPRNIFENKIVVGKKSRNFSPPPPPPPPQFFLRFKTSGRCFCEKQISVTQNCHNLGWCVCSMLLSFPPRILVTQWSSSTYMIIITAR